MTYVVLAIIGVVSGVTTVLFGFGGGFVTVPAIAWADSRFGAAASAVAISTSAVVMVLNAAIATVATPRSTLRALRGRTSLIALLGCGAAGGAVVSHLVPGWLLRWGFVGFLALVIVRVLLQPGFVRPNVSEERPRRPSDPTGSRAPLPTATGVPIGAVSAFLGIGGSVMIVPTLHRAGLPMRVAAALANPLTLAIAVPAAVVGLSPVAAHAAVSGVGFLGSVDSIAAALLVATSTPVIVLLRRHPPHIGERAYAVSYVALLIVSLLVVALV